MRTPVKKLSIAIASALVATVIALPSQTVASISSDTANERHTDQTTLTK